jgi:hypothetical protein
LMEEEGSDLDLPRRSRRRRPRIQWGSHRGRRGREGAAAAATCVGAMSTPGRPGEWREAWKSQREGGSGSSDLCGARKRVCAESEGKSERAVRASGSRGHWLDGSRGHGRGAARSSRSYVGPSGWDGRPHSRKIVSKINLGYKRSLF